MHFFKTHFESIWNVFSWSRFLKKKVKFDVLIMPVRQCGDGVGGVSVWWWAYPADVIAAGSAVATSGCCLDSWMTKKKKGKPFTMFKQLRRGQECSLLVRGQNSWQSPLPPFEVGPSEPPLVSQTGLTWRVTPSLLSQRWSSCQKQNLCSLNCWVGTKTTPPLGGFFYVCVHSTVCQWHNRLGKLCFLIKTTHFAGSLEIWLNGALGSMFGGALWIIWEQIKALVVQLHIFCAR